MTEFGRDLLVRGIGAARAKSWDEVRFFFDKLLGGDPPVEMRVEAWRCLAEMANNPAEKRDYVGRILAFDPTASGRIDMDSCQLLLLPFWSAPAGPAGAHRLSFVNGQTGQIGENNREPGLLSWIAGIIGLSPDSDKS